MDSTTPTTEASEPATTPPAPNRFFEWMRGLDLPRQTGWIGGVCSGIAARLGIDPLIVRGIFVVIAVFGGPALLAYAVAWLLLPDSNNKIHAEEVTKGRFESPVAAIGVVLLLSFLPLAQGFWAVGANYWGEPYWGQSLGRGLWTIVVLGLIVAFVVWVARRSNGTSPPATPTPGARFTAPASTASSPTVSDASTPTAPASSQPEDVAAWRAQQAQVKAEHLAFRNQQAAEAQRIARERSRAANAAARAEYAAKRARTQPNTLFTLIVIGAAIIAAALTVLYVGGGSIRPTDIVAGLAVGLAVLAIGILINGIRGKRSGGASAVAFFVVIALIVASIVPTIPRFIAVGNLSQSPQLGEEWRTPYFIGSGSARIDLTDYFDRATVEEGLFLSPSFELWVGEGDVTVILPADQFAYVTAEVGSGRIEMAPGENYPGNGLEVEGSTLSFFEQYTFGEAEEFPGERSLNVHVRVGSGEVTIERETPALTEGTN